MTFAMLTTAPRFIFTLAAALYGAAAGAAPPLYRITIVPQPPLASSQCYVKALNDAGQIAINCGDNYLWSPATGSRFIFDLQAQQSLDVRAINNAGVVAGNFVPWGQSHSGGFVWSASSGFTYFGNESWDWNVKGINDSNEVVGSSYLIEDPAPLTKAFKWSPGAGVKHMQPQRNKSTIASDINNAGLFAGEYFDADVQILHAMLYDPSGKTTSLLPGHKRNSEVYAINNLGHVAGRFEKLSRKYRAFVWTPESGAIEIDGRPNELRNQSRALDLNDAGQAVGEIEGLDTQGNHYANAFYWDASNGLLDLVSLLDPTDPLRERVTTLSGSSARINSNGQIAITGHDSFGNYFPLLLSPVP